jgi:hypothetical protein
LADTQQRFAAALLTASAAPMADLVAAPAARLAVYRNNLAASWGRALRNTYPVIAQLVGDAFFTALCHEYGLGYATEDADLNAFGSRFADFLAAFPHVAELPYLPDMARLEWLVHRTHYAARTPVLDAAALGGMTPEDFAGSTLPLNAAATPFASAWAVVPLWQAHQEDGTVAFPGAMAHGSHALVHRTGWRVDVMPLDGAAHAMLMQLKSGTSVAAALDAALATDAAFDLTPWLAQWLACGAFAAPRGPGNDQ